MPDYIAALRTGMGMRPVVVVTLPSWAGKMFFNIGEVFGAHFVNLQTWHLPQTGTCSRHEYPDAIPYAAFATPHDRAMTQDTQLYWFARLGDHRIAR